MLKQKSVSKVFVSHKSEAPCAHNGMLEEKKSMTVVEIVRWKL